MRNYKSTRSFSESEIKNYQDKKDLHIELKTNSAKTSPIMSNTDDILLVSKDYYKDRDLTYTSTLSQKNKL